MAETFNEYFINIGMKMAAESGNQSTDSCNSERDVNPPKKPQVWTVYRQGF